MIIFYSTGSCFIDQNQAKFETRAAVSGLILRKVDSEDHCFQFHQHYVLNITFKYLTMRKSWKVKLDGYHFADPSYLLSEKGLKVTVKIDIKYYFRRIGDFKLDISVSDGIFEKTIERDVCVRFFNKKVKVSAEQVSMPGRAISFFFTTTDPSLGICRIIFGDGRTYNSSTNIRRKLYVIKSTYTQLGLYRYTWSVRNSTHVALGTGQMTILNPVMEAGHYLFPLFVKKSWPDNRVQFYFKSKCQSPIPTYVSYRIHFGDGEIMPWTRMPDFNCKNKTNLTRHIYQKADCYKSYFEMKNLLGRCEMNGTVKIRQRLSSLRLDFNSIPPSRKVEKDYGGVKEVHLKCAYPFHIVATTTGGSCLKFEWKIAKPYWLIPAGTNSKIQVNHLVNKAGTYDLEVKVFNDISSITEKRKLILGKSLRGLILLASKPDITGKTDFYLLLEEFGDGAEFLWDFKDNNTVIRQKMNKLRPARSLRGIIGIRGTENLNLTRYMGYVRQHNYTSKGLYDVSITATDQLTSLVANRTVYVSTSNCKRPEVKILPKNQKLLQYSLGETFVIPSDVKLQCDNFNKAAFRWRIYVTNKEALESDRVAESDKMIRLVTKIFPLCDFSNYDST